MSYTNQSDTCRTGPGRVVVPRQTLQELEQLDARAQANAARHPAMRARDAAPVGGYREPAAPILARSASSECADARGEADFRLRSALGGSPQAVAAQWNVQLACSAVRPGTRVNEADCARARHDLLFRANSTSASAAAIDAAHANAAAACGLPVPAPTAVAPPAVEVVQELPFWPVAPGVVTYPVPDWHPPSRVRSPAPRPYFGGRVGCGPGSPALQCQ